MITITVEHLELTALIDWHIREKRNSIDDEEFTNAEYHRNRALVLMQIREEADKGKTT